jgi:hypothetical protein
MILLGDPFPSAPTRQVAAVAEREPWTLLKTITSVDWEGATTAKSADVSATCPIGRAIADSHGHSRADHPRPRRSQYQQMAAGQRHRVPKLTVQISDVWVADNQYAGGSVGVLPPLPRERQGSATSSPQVGSIDIQRCVGAGNLLTFDLSTSRRPARGHGYLADLCTRRGGTS